MSHLGRDKATRVALGVVIAVTLAAWAAVLAVYWWNFGGNLSGDNDKWGQFGDYVGGLLNPVLGTFTLLGVLYTVRLQRSVLRVTQDQLIAAESQAKEAHQAARNQRLLAEQQAFETGFFKLLDVATEHAHRSYINLAPKDFEPPTDAPRLHADGLLTHFTEENVFPTIIRAVGGRFRNAFDRGDVSDHKRGEYLRSQVGPFFVAHDNGVGPFLRSMADLFEYVEDHDMRLAATVFGEGLRMGTQQPDPQVPDIQGPEFYARVAANNRTRFEMKVFGDVRGERSIVEPTSRDSTKMVNL